MDEVLKPCPFCGSPPMPDYCSTTDGPAYSFHCHAKDCPAWPNVQGETEAEAIAAWNTRADAAPPPNTDEVKAVARAISEARTGNTLSYRHFVPEALAAIAALDVARGDPVAQVVEWLRSIGGSMPAAIYADAIERGVPFNG